MALDYGKHRVGVAVGDFSVKMAFPRCVIENKNRKFLINSIFSICAELNPVIVLVGLPMNMEENLEDNKMMVEVKKFAGDLKKVLPRQVEIKLWDERLSSFEAESLIRSSDISSKEAKSFADSVAAQVILNRFFEEF